MDWAVPKSVFSTSESSAKEKVEIKEEEQDHDEESVKKSTSGVNSCDVQPIEIKKEPLSDDDDDDDSKSNTNESSDSEEDHRDE